MWGGGSRGLAGPLTPLVGMIAGAVDMRGPWRGLPQGSCRMCSLAGLLVQLGWLRLCCSRSSCCDLMMMRGLFTAGVLSGGCQVVVRLLSGCCDVTGSSKWVVPLPVLTGTDYYVGVQPTRSLDVCGCCGSLRMFSSWTAAWQGLEHGWWPVLVTADWLVLAAGRASAGAAASMAWPSCVC